MIYRHGLYVYLLGTLILFMGCISTAKTAISPGSPEDLPGCYDIFPAVPWESVHKIDAFIRGEISSSMVGVTKGDPAGRRLQSLLLSPEGFTLFDAVLREDGIVLQKAVPPFDSSDFARGLMEDVTLLFLSPPGRPTTWGKEADGIRICRWNGTDGSRTEVRGSMDHGWRILRLDKYGKVVKEVILNGPFVNGLASHMELRAFKPESYRLRMTLLQTSP